MPITITDPATGVPISWGMNLHLQTDFIGPIDPSFVWSVQWFSLDERSLYWSRNGIPLSHINDHTLQLSLADPSSVIQSSVNANLQAGSDIHLVATLGSSDGSVVLDAAEGQQRPWSDTSSLPEWIRAVETSSTTGGLTPEQAEQLATTFSSVTQVVGEGAGSIQQLLSDFMQQVPTIKLQFTPDPIVVNGPTSIDISSTIGHRVYGYWVEFLTVPPGFSRLNGNFPQYSPRVAQIVEVADFLGTNLAVNVRELRIPNLVFMWDFWQGWKPHFLQVDVTPGCTIVIHLLSLV